MINKSLLFLLLTLFAIVPAKSQSIGNSPYSRFGIGEMNNRGLIRNIGMGGLSVSTPSAEYLNLENPALLTTNRRLNLDSTLKYTMFEGAGTGSYHKLQNNSSSQKNTGASFSYFHFAFPVSNRFTSAIGLEPYSQVNYKNVYRENNEDALAEYNYSGTGGLYKAQLSGGYDINKNFSAGVQLGYLFGNIKDNSSTRIISMDPSLNELSYGINQRTSYSGILIKPGFAYRNYLNPAKQMFYNLGATAEFTSGQVNRVKQRQQSNSLNNISVDTTFYNQNKHFSAPVTYKIGFSVDVPKSWMAGVEFAYYNYSSYKNFDSDNLENAYRISVGGEYLFKGAEELKRKTIRLGLAYGKTPVSINGNTVNDMSLSIGGSIPVGRKDARFKSKPLNKINIALVAGQMGNIGSTSVKDSYLRLSAGILVIDKWFERRRIE